MIAPDPARGELGLTLVEMLVVLAIIAVMAGAVAMSIGSGTGRTAEAEARRLAARLELAGDEAMVSGSTVGFAWDRGSYRFMTLKAGKWQDDAAPALEPHSLPAGLAIDADITGPIVVGADGGGSPIALRLASDKGSSWTVAFDGVQALARAGG
jgi:general secretion pathway protein H